MDTITQIALGSATGYAAGHKKLGKHALLWGAIGGLIPDLDVLLTPFFGQYGEWLYHRGITHSLFFAPVVAPILAWIIWMIARRYRPQSIYAQIENIKSLAWALFFALITHPLLDSFTVYGTQLLAPFSDTRFSWPAVSIIDPLYSLPLLITIIYAGFAKQEMRAVSINAAILLSTSIYLMFGLAQNMKAEELVHQSLFGHQAATAQVFATPTMFQPFLRRVVAMDQDNLKIGFVSTWNPKPIAWYCFSRKHQDVPDAIAEDKGFQIFSWFADQKIWLTRKADDQGNVTYVFTDLRYGFPPSTLTGFWGIQYVLSKQGEMIKMPQRFFANRAITEQHLKDFYAAIWGESNDLFPVAAETVSNPNGCAAT